MIVIRLDIHSSVGRQFTAEYDFQYTPTFIFFNEQGVEQWRVIGSLDTAQVLASLED